MSAIDDKLSALLSAQAPPAQDMLFRLEVMRRIERKAVMSRSLTVALAGLAGVILLLVLAPLMPASPLPVMPILASILGLVGAGIFAYAPRRSL